MGKLPVDIDSLIQIKRLADSGDKIAIAVYAILMKLFSLPTEVEIVYLS